MSSRGFCRGLPSRTEPTVLVTLNCDGFAVLVQMAGSRGESAPYQEKENDKPGAPQLAIGKVFIICLYNGQTNSWTPDRKLECEAVSFARRATSGRSKPPLVFAETPFGETVEVWLKAPRLHPGISDTAPSREWMAARLAEDLGLPCPPPILVRLTDDFTESLSDENLAESLRAGPSVVYGAIHLGSGWRRWSEANKMPRHQHQIQGQTYLFDTIIQNWDRRIANPNILKKGDEFRILDHEECFGSATAPDDEKPFIHVPWSVGGLTNFIAGDYQHPFWRTLKPSNHVDFNVAAQTWKRLPADTFSMYANDAPPEWGAACDDIASYLTLAVQHIDEVVVAIEGARQL
ncbi:HipA family kinase [Roseinatronobacter alkalisoli]|uniref:HipA-like kinase domain-containing protein n=1 Tax=Roseinatronobacter alkalisoli TaxID=3028235 RepID=A0ABT5TFL3_9RHOB|nr:HipA family kinase [Roseinatronobacter sp. HJB301]MDD7973920.1 hypothetical protein [Roseinatronobacter sp. HJB301]